MQKRCGGQFGTLAGAQSCAVQGGMPVTDGDGALAPMCRHPRGDGHQAAAQQCIVDLELLIARIASGLVGHHPHLHEMHGLGVFFGAGDSPGVVAFRVQDAATGRQPLRQSGIDHPVVAGGVLVHQGALEYPGHDLHIAVRVGVEPGAGCHHIVVVHQQQSVMGVRRVVVLGEGEGMLGIQPRRAGGGTLRGTSDIDRLHEISLGSCA